MPDGCLDMALGRALVEEEPSFGEGDLGSRGGPGKRHCGRLGEFV